MDINIPVDNFISSCSNLTGITAVKFLNSMSSNARYYITDVCAINQHATASNIVKILSGTTVMGYLASKAVTEAIPQHFDPPLRMQDAQAVSFQLLSITSDAFVNVNGYIAR